MKRILRLLLIVGPCLFLFVKDVKAYANGYEMETPTNVSFYDHNSTNSFSVMTSEPIFADDGSSNGFTTINTFHPGKYGFSTSFCGPQFVKDNYYSVSIYYLDRVHHGYLHPRYASYSSLVGIGSSTYNAMAYSNISDLSYNSNDNYIKAPSLNSGSSNVWLGSVSYVFKADATVNCMRVSLSSTSNQTNYELGDYIFLGYRIENQGSKQLSANDIQSIFNNEMVSLNSAMNTMQNSINNLDTTINNAFGNVNDKLVGIGSDLINSATNINDNIDSATDSINSSINDMNNNISSSIDNMKDDIDNSINSDDDDTSSKKCGIVCKLKGIWTGIVHLPEYIWNSLKGGFEAISNGISSLFEGIKNIFVPEEKCEVSKNLFDFTQDYNKTHSSPINLLEYTRLDNGFRLTSKSSNTTLILIFDVFPVSKYNGKTLTLSANVSTGGSLQIGYRYYNGSSNNYVYDTTNKYTSSHSLIINSNKTGGSGYVSLYFIVEPGQVVDFTDIMLVEGNEVLSYEEFGKETCTGGGSFFDWFGNFFKSIVNGILELPGKLVSLILDGLKMLFVPTDDQLYEIVNDSKELTENFGFVGESVNFFLTIFTSLLGLVNANGCIELPEFSIGATSLFDAHTFWQAQNVCLSDNVILSANISTIRTITSIALVCLFINFAAKKFFNILSKNDSGEVSEVDMNTGEVSYSRWTRTNGDYRRYKF